MRRKKWARPELAVCPYYRLDPRLYRGNWQAEFSKKQPLFIELGCGKGGFLAQNALAHPENNYLGIDMISDMLGVARRQIQSAFGAQKRPVDNILLTSWDITRIEMMLSEQDITERIFINFCNPWFKPKQYKKRLTHPRQLQQYRAFLRTGGEVWFKTDDDALFNQSVSYFADNGFACVYQTQDLHNSGFSPNYMTEHEKMYSDEGVLIKFGIFRKF